jgi:putative inorganic carbon (HCO3(-)) transporter
MKEQQRKLGKRGWLGLLSFLVLVYLAIDLYLMSKDQYYLNILPLLVFLAWLGFRSIDKLLLITVFLTPFSILLDTIVPTTGFNLSLPTEPLLVLILILMMFKLIMEGGLDQRLLVHPVSIAVYFYLLWMFLTSLTSSMFLVSIKYFIARLWFVMAFYFLAAQVFIEKKNMQSYLWAYILPFTAVIIYTLYRHSQQGLVNQVAAHTAVHPFYNDHTAYGATLAFYLPFLAVFFVSGQLSGSKRLWYGLLAALFLFATVFSYSRATWLSLVLAVAFLLLLLLRIRLLTLGIVTLIAAGYLYMFRAEILMKMEQNKQTSSKEFTQHIQSITNITSDASNAERINRWKSAFRMFRERPITGWGPGTYQFKYAPFQRYREKTYISTNFGNLGSAHSEYFGPLSESGVLGIVSFLLVMILSLYTGVRVYWNIPDRNMRLLTLGVLLGMVTYFFHGWLNNFLHTDKASVPFWGFTAILVVMDICYSPGSKAMTS